MANGIGREEFDFSPGGGTVALNALASALGGISKGISSGRAGALEEAKVVQAILQSRRDSQAQEDRNAPIQFNEEIGQLLGLEGAGEIDRRIGPAFVQGQLATERARVTGRAPGLEKFLALAIKEIPEPKGDLATLTDTQEDRDERARQRLNRALQLKEISDALNSGEFKKTMKALGLELRPVKKPAPGKGDKDDKDTKSKKKRTAADVRKELQKELK